MHGLHCINPSEDDGHYIIDASTEMEDELNSDRFITLKIIENEVNELFIRDIDNTWSIKGVEGPDDDTEWKIINIASQGNGNKQVVSIKAQPAFFNDLNKKYIYEVFGDVEYSATEYFNLIFQDTPYTFNLIDSFDSVSWEGLNDSPASKLQMFKDGLENYEAEFEITGNQVDIHAKIERQQAYFMHWKLNAKDVQKDVDASEFWTHVKGFANFDSEEKFTDAKIKEEYTSSIANIPGIGKQEAPPIIDNELTSSSKLKTALKDLVDSSVAVSITAGFQYLIDYPYAIPRNGDLIDLYDDRIGLETKTRIVKVNTTRNSFGEVTARTVTLGAKGLSERYKSNLQSIGKLMSDLEKGRRKLPASFMPAAHQLATKLLLSANTELNFENGIIAVDKDDPNKVVLFNAAGLGISEDGGQTFTTAMTGAGIVADSITSGQIKTHNVMIQGTEGVFWIDGDELRAIDPNDSERYVEIGPGWIRIKGDGLSLIRPDGYEIIHNGLMVADYAVQSQISPPIDPGVNGTGIQRGGYNWVVTTTTKKEIAYLGFKHDARFLNIQVQQRTKYSATENIITIETTGTTPDILAESRSTNVSEDYEDLQKIITIDLGKPDGGQRNIWVRTKGSTDNEVYTAVLRAWLSG